MTIQQSIEIVETHNKWRRGAEIPMNDPTELGIALVTIVAFAKRSFTKPEYLEAAELGEVSMIDAKHVVSLLDEVRNGRKCKSCGARTDKEYCDICEAKGIDAYGY